MSPKMITYDNIAIVMMSLSKKCKLLKCFQSIYPYRISRILHGNTMRVCFLHVSLFYSPFFLLRELAVFNVEKNAEELKQLFIQTIKIYHYHICLQTLVLKSYSENFTCWLKKRHQKPLFPPKIRQKKALKNRKNGKNNY